MPDTGKETVSRIIDAMSRLIDGKDASAKTFQDEPFGALAEFESWGQDENDSQNDTPRTRALFLAYVVLSGGRIPLTGIALDDGYFRPDLWVAGALVKKGYMIVDHAAGELRATAKGWNFVAETLEGLKGA